MRGWHDLGCIKLLHAWASCTGNYLFDSNIRLQSNISISNINGLVSFKQLQQVVFLGVQLI